ncbi:uncharacterized protein [Triticum aestivum]|uniref:uncharacterized protein n=1 Tax=Triticum aestivum TaxID=4565 RepID=UPI001D009216|nr:uncharacterized protein LOC123076194 [Triticum aestivum]
MLSPRRLLCSTMPPLYKVQRHYTEKERRCYGQQLPRAIALDPGGASSCWLELGCKRVDGSMPHKHCAMLSPTPWLQGGRVRRDHQFGDLRHYPCRYHGHLHHCVLHQQPPAQGKAARVEASEMLCSSEVADYSRWEKVIRLKCNSVTLTSKFYN